MASRQFEMQKQRRSLVAKMRRKIRSSGKIGTISRQQARSAVTTVRDRRMPKNLLKLFPELLLAKPRVLEDVVQRTLWQILAVVNRDGQGSASLAF